MIMQEFNMAEVYFIAENTLEFEKYFDISLCIASLCIASN